MKQERSGSGEFLFDEEDKQMDICEVLYKKQYRSWRELEQEIENIYITTVKGDVFEQFCYYYLIFHKSLYQITEVYSNKVPGHEITREIINKLHMNPSIDDGVDGVFVMYDGSYAAYQAKFRSFRRSPTSNELNNFWSEAEYADQRMVIANSMSLPSDVERRSNATFVLGHIFDQLQGEFFAFLYDSACADHERRRGSFGKKKYTPRDYQKAIIEACVNGFKKADRGKVIAACAAGKTLISLWVSERMQTNTVVFFTPNLALVRQTIANWTQHCNVPFVYLAVCSDDTVSEDADTFTINSDELDIAVTTHAADICSFLRYQTETKKVIFSTYQSVDSIIDALKQIPDFRFDFGVYDESHRTAGPSTSGLCQKALLDTHIPVRKRLFMTATERLATPRLKQRFEQQNRVLFSMDDEEKYGKVFYRLPFGKAISEGIVADYKIVVAAMTSSELYRIVQGNAYVTVSHKEEEIVADVAAQNLFKGAMFSKAMFATGATKAVSFHSSIPAAKRFVDLIKKLPELPNNRYIAHINGSFSAAERTEVFRNFEGAPFGLITNVRCLTEGVDIPYIDAIMFADPRNSLIDIVQAVGRALRKPFGVEKKTSYIIVPILLNENNGGIEDDDAFATMHAIIQALRDQDEMLADWIDRINFAVVTGNGGGGGGGFTDDDPVSVILSEEIDYDKFCNNLALRISVANGRPSGTTGLGSSLGRNERGSSIVRVFKTIADYNYQALKDSLIDPTMERFDDASEYKTREEILINNNNISHTQRLGLIRHVSKYYELTQLGRQYKDHSIDFIALFTKQMLYYCIESNGHTMYPYRAALKVMSQVRTLNYFEFLYGLYSMDISLDEKDAVGETVARIEILREKYPNIMATSMGNQESIRTMLNDIMGIEYSERDVWTDRTTTGNQYRFFLNHISLLTDCFIINFRRKQIEVTNTEQVEKVLNATAEDMLKTGFEYGGRIE